MKRRWVVFLLAAGCISMAACSGQEEKTEKDTQNEQTEQTGEQPEVSEKPEVEASGSSENTQQQSEEEQNPEDIQAEEDDMSAQIQILADTKDLWKPGEEDMYGSFGYVVTDLDQDGSLEIITSMMAGTGFFSTNRIWEVNDSMDGITECQKASSDDSEPDIMQEDTNVFYDEENNVYYYIFTDFIRQGAAENETYKESFYLKDHMVNTDFIAYRSMVYKSEDDVITRFEDHQGNEISEDEFESAENEKYKMLKKKDAHFEWIYDIDVDVDTLSAEELYNSLMDSWNAFSIH